MPRELVRKLRKLGYDCLYINKHEGYDQFMSDRNIIKLAEKFGAVIVTRNSRDFEKYKRVINLDRMTDVEDMLGKVVNDYESR